MLKQDNLARFILSRVISWSKFPCNVLIALKHNKDKKQCVFLNLEGSILPFYNRKKIGTTF
jgi:hypothetical protein